ncbi:hypothetical protein GCM10023081_42900 [Arthrobacter ginkgonis]|uniref:Uncharacterized protein n=1 Tax=Arthrobacter ginkgonis TaxID=1630594 RepID=A0ABP7DAV9_9MICC
MGMRDRGLLGALTYLKQRMIMRTGHLDAFAVSDIVAAKEQTGYPTDADRLSHEQVGI